MNNFKICKDEQTYNKKEILQVLTSARTSLLLKAPFYGNILMHLKFGVAACGTACTDMKRILWDPVFVKKLSSEDIEIVMQHEVLHCALQHPLRGKGLNQLLYNVAADIVVNSNIIQSKGIDYLVVCGKKIMYRAPNSKPGYLYTAEQVYDMLLEEYKDLIDDVDELCGELAESGISVDKHDIWESVPLDTSLSEEWKQYVKEEAKRSAEKYDLPPSARMYLEELNYQASVNWKMVLHDFIQITYDRYDYTFHPADRRFSNAEFVLPAFWGMEGQKVEKLWFLVDTSGSIDNETLTGIYIEIKTCIEQFADLTGKLSFFDTSVTEPVEFSTVEDLKEIEPWGGGGTSFYNIFKYLKEYMMDDLPIAIIILTDGHASYPSKEKALGVPVLWIIVNNEQDAPWGKTVHIEM